MSDVEFVEEFDSLPPSPTLNDSEAIAATDEAPVRHWPAPESTSSDAGGNRANIPHASLNLPAVKRSAGLIRDDYERRQVRQSAAEVLLHAPLVWTRAIIDEESPARVRLRMLRWLAEAGRPGKDNSTSNTQ